MLSVGQCGTAMSAVVAERKRKVAGTIIRTATDCSFSPYLYFSAFDQIIFNSDYQHTFFSVKATNDAPLIC